jgi:glycosyl transferase, family 25
MKTYIIHVSDAIQRERHINSQLIGKKLNVEFVSEGDIKDLSEPVIANYFKEQMSTANSIVSCAYKHIISYRKLLESNDDIALILEDDIYFYSNFDHIFEKLLKEIGQRQLDNFLLSIEDTTLTYIANSKRRNGILIYAETMGRTAGAYLVDRKAATRMLDEVKKNKMGLPIDWFHNLCIEQGIVNMYWSQPAISCQKSHDGSLGSIIGNKKSSILRVISFNVQKAYKKLLYGLR